MSALTVLAIIVHIVLSIALIYFALHRMQKNAELGGAFGSGAAHTMFGREKGFDPAAKMALWTGVLFMISSFIVTALLAR
ncbi:preprotein translocase subunit SecG [Marinitoga sp. 1135]|uniref:Protein-export membrane protein SecG n=1 Tax=Marinitoga piezophila (strain DSM 14283 / JCM 11233 / KA3) TaxID=443254 RepID=H2J5H5_MARPK|nr:MULTISPECIES: preprotein translocase subunit SecG [Marinitoga]AEX86119.1 protein translocase, SecG subunit [Marinitoga piezophila KA3]APT76535.1 preprotein translocase subunit SecG [Marinitoga sp. 1137]NUU96304.1 preprotein translocase subunit SecG [Marinitoga sp. 1135]NUU98222.1 preprotein translocase subunit SecG [Marinitoga sp. 1138]